MEGFIVERNFIFYLSKAHFASAEFELDFQWLRYSETDTRQLIGEQLCYIRSLTSP